VVIQLSHLEVNDLSQVGIYNPYTVLFSPSNITPKQRLQEILDIQGGYSLMARDLDFINGSLFWKRDGSEENFFQVDLNQIKKL
jgi:hypothetical protein